MLTHPIKALSLDIWQTLIRLNPAFKPAQIRFLQKKTGVENFALLQKAVLWVEESLEAQTNHTGEDFDFDKRVKAIFEKLETENIATQIRTKDLTTNLLEMWYEEMEGFFLANPPKLIEADLAETLQKIREKNIKIGLLSNTGFVRGRTMRKALEQMRILELTDFQFFSNEMQMAKPDRRFFEFLEEKMACPPQQILHIGDNYEADYQGATQMNWQAFWFSEKKHYLSDLKPLQIGSIKQLLSIL